MWRLWVQPQSNGSSWGKSRTESEADIGICSLAPSSVGGVSYSSVAPYLARPLHRGEMQNSRKMQPLNLPVSQSACHAHVAACWSHLIAGAWLFTSLKAWKLICFTTGWAKCKSPVDLTLVYRLHISRVAPVTDASACGTWYWASLPVLMWSLFWCNPVWIY